MIELFLAKGRVLDEAKLAIFYNAVCPPRSGVLAKFDATAAGLQHKSFATATDTDSAGQFEALVAVFNNLDKGGDRIMPGAFTKTLAEWRASGDPVPVIWSHEWGTPDSHIGVAYAKDMQQTARGLLVKGQLDIDDNPVASRVHKLMQRRSVKEFSFGYSVPAGGQRKASDGANELIEIDLFEIGPTLKGMNPATELHSVKGIAQRPRRPPTTRLRPGSAPRCTRCLPMGATSPGRLRPGRLRIASTASRRAGTNASCAASATGSGSRRRSAGTPT